MSLNDCLLAAIKARVVTGRQAEKVQKFIADNPDMPERDILESFIQEAAENRRRTHLQVIASKRNLADVEAHPGGVGMGVLAKLGRDPTGGATYSNIDFRRRAILGDLYSKFTDALDAYRPKNLGFSQDEAGLKRMVKELFGESSGNTDAARYAQLWRETAEAARLRFNAAGGNIPMRRDWGLVHVHDAQKIAAVPFEEWKADIVPRLNRAKMYNQAGLLMSDNQLDTLLKGLYERFTQSALAVGTETPRNVPKDVDHRLLTFRNSQGWMEYNYKYGEPNILESMTRHIDNLAGDTALMEILGPSPDAEFRQLTKRAADAGTGYAVNNLIKNTYETVSGRVDQTGSNLLANLGAGVRSLLNSAFLGSAWFSNLGDYITASTAAHLNGMPATSVIKTALSLMNPANKEDRALAVRMGLGAEAWLSNAHSGWKYGELSAHGGASRLSDLTMRLSLVKPQTDALKAAFGLELSGFVADNVGEKLAELPEPLQRALARYGIDELRWNIIRKTPLVSHQGATFIRAGDVLELSRKEVKGLADVFESAGEYATAEEKLRGNRPGALGVRLESHGAQAKQAMGRIDTIRDAANRLGEFFQTESSIALTEPDAVVKGFVTQGQKRGTLLGEIARSFGLFKAFPISAISTHLLRGALELDGTARAKYLSELLIGSTIMGAVALLGKSIVKGRDPESFQTANFWARAAAQGGGLGLIGDYLASAENRYGKGIMATIGGPVADLADDLSKLTMGNFTQYLEGKDPKLAADLVKLAQKYQPGGNLFYTRLVMQRLFYDQLLQLADPDAAQGFRRIVQAAQRDYSQSFWWRPGETAPERGPNISRALGE